MGENAIIFGVDMSSSMHIDNKKKDILILGEGPIQGLMISHQQQKLNILLTFCNQKKYFYQAYTIMEATVS